MRRAAEIYGAWILGVLSTCIVAYWFYHRSEVSDESDTDIVNTDDTVDTVSTNSVSHIRPRTAG